VGGGGGARTWALFVACDKKKLSIPACHSQMLPRRLWDLAAAAVAATQQKSGSPTPHRCRLTPRRYRHWRLFDQRDRPTPRCHRH